MKSLGYEVIEVDDAASAREVLSGRTDIDLLLSDVLMPGDMDGIQLAAWTQANTPSVKVLLVSGYTKGARTDVEAERFPLVEKPYQTRDLARAIKRSFDSNF